MQKLALTIFVVVAAVTEFCFAAYDPCNGRSTIGGQCDRDYDCAGFGVICKNNKCDCHYYYQMKNDSDGSKYCAKLPDTIKSSCTNLCRFPMFCSNGQCQCVRATTDGNRCYPSSKLGDSCSQDPECTQPFTSCIGGRCSCVAGTTNGNGQCVAAQHCPDGSKPSGNCVRLSYDRSLIENKFTNKDLDTCSSGSYCYTSDTSLGGFCCPVSCPYNTAPNTAFTCEPGASNPCPLDTHYCHRLAGQTFSTSACCRRPCKEPTPLYVLGKCYARAWLGSPCSINEQCQGGDMMQCANGQCVCKSGFTPQTGSYITSENPPQFCVKSCSSGTARGGECFSGANLGAECDVDDQCPSNGKCSRGVCACNCNNGFTKSGSSCVKVTTTTGSPGSNGVTNSGSGGFLGLVNGLLGKGGGGGSSGGNGGGGGGGGGLNLGGLGR